MQAWTAAHINDDPVRLRLRHRGDPDILQAIMQIECRRKTASRLPLALSCPSFLFPTSLSAEQATSESLARIHADIAGYGPATRHLDLTAGLAIDAFEAARRGASVTAIEIDPQVAAAAVHNASALGLPGQLEVFNADSAIYIDQTTDSWDTIFIDPARRGDGGRRLTSITSCHPDVTAMLPRLLALAPRVVIKASPMLDLSALASELDMAARPHGATARMIAVGTGRECKEVVAVVERDHCRAYVMEAITALPGGEVSVFSPGRSWGQAPVVMSMPAPGDYLYEPYPAVMKTASWGAIAAAGDGLSQLNPNTHLFVSSRPAPSFPGLGFVIERCESMGSRGVKAIAAICPEANITVRNFVMPAPDLARRMKIKEGGTMRLYGARCGAAGTPMLLLCRPL